MRQYLFMALAAVLASAGLGRSAVLRVPEDYPSVLAGVDAAVAGDSVLVGPGTWTERAVRTILVFGAPLTVESAMYLKPGVTVIGTAGAQVTTLDGGSVGTYPLYTIEHVIAGPETTRVVGFTVTGRGHGVAVSASSPLELFGCRITGNDKGAITFRQASLILSNCVVSENEFNPGGPVVGAVSGVDVAVNCTGCTFAHNAGPGLSVSMAQGYGYGITVTLYGCVFQDHTLRGAVLGDVPYLDIERCTFLRNSVNGGMNGSGGGLSLTRCYGSVRFSTFAFDSAGGGGGADIEYASVRVENNTFYGCHAGILGGALTIGGTDAGTVANIFAFSTGRRGAVTGTTRNPQTGCNLYWANAGGDYYGDWLPAPTDIRADPLFCDPATLDFHLQAASPAAPANSGGCGLIGAFDVNCGLVSVEPTSWGRLKGMYR